VHKKTLTGTPCVRNLIKKRQLIVHRKTPIVTDSVVMTLNGIKVHMYKIL